MRHGCLTPPNETQCLLQFTCKPGLSLKSSLSSASVCQSLSADTSAFTTNHHSTHLPQSFDTLNPPHQRDNIRKPLARCTSIVAGKHSTPRLQCKPSPAYLPCPCCCVALRLVGCTPVGTASPPEVRRGPDWRSVPSSSAHPETATAAGVTSCSVGAGWDADGTCTLLGADDATEALWSCTTVPLVAWPAGAAVCWSEAWHGMSADVRTSRKKVSNC